MLSRPSLIDLSIAALAAASCGVGVEAADDATDTDASTATSTTALIDADGDGVTVEAGDCDDRNHTVRPGARERSLDGRDSDCDGDELPTLGENKFEAAKGIIDTDKDGVISLEEFSAACARSAMTLGVARPGVVRTHASCSGTSVCRGMILHPWSELFEHDCRGVNYCKGWSCTETAVGGGEAGADRDGAAVYEASCQGCHGDHDDATSTAFVVMVPAGEDVGAFVASFPSRSDERFRSVIAFGAAGVTASDHAYLNMPAHYETLSRGEIDAVIAHLRTLPLKGQAMTPPDEGGPHEGM